MSTPPTTTSARGIKEIVIAHCGPVAEIVSRKLADLLLTTSKEEEDGEGVRVLSRFSLGEIEKNPFLQIEEDDDDDATIVVIVETIENDEIAREGEQVAKFLLKEAKRNKEEAVGAAKKEEEEKKKKRRFVLVGVGDSNILADRQYFRSNQNSAEDCNAAARYVDKLLEKSGRWERVGKRLELDCGRDFEGKLEKWVRARRADIFAPKEETEEFTR
jgi:hypothetical protein